MTSPPQFPCQTMFRQFRLSVLVLLCLSVWTANSTAAEKISFNRDVRPILSDRCFLCHGPDNENREADLRLDVAEEAYKALDFGEASHVIKPGQPEQSEVFLRIIAENASTKMPPPETKIDLTNQEIETIRKWIEQGAEYEGHWSFVPPEKPTPPEVQESSWIGNEIDRFVLKQIELNRLTPNRTADKAKLLRRISFDLTGLPPTLEELDAFLEDTASDAYEKAVDRLLASPRFGERMASDWLDVARYSDTYGYQVDRDRYVWPWRDWVIQAFNKNMPYDQFVTEQLAGDLLPHATDDQILATTFNRLHPQKVEGGSTPEEFRIEYIADRTQTFGTAFLGLTFECCRCHDHKYDPLSQKEYYQLSSFFDNIDEAGLYSYFTPAVPTPTLLLTNDQQKQEIEKLKAAVRVQEAKLAELGKSSQPGLELWKQGVAGNRVTPVGQVYSLDFEEVKGRNQAVAGVIGNAVKLTGDDAIGTGVGNFKRSEPFSVSLWLNTPDVKERAVVFHRSRAWTDAASRGYQLLIEEGKLSASLIHFWPGNAIRVKTLNPIPIKEWQHVVITYDGSSRASGLRIFINGGEAETEIVRDHLTKQITGGGGDNIAIGERFRDKGFKNGLVDEFRVFDRELTAPEVLTLSRLDEIDTPQPYEPEDLKAYFLTNISAGYQAELVALETAREKLNTYIDRLPEIMVMRELANKKPTYRLERGAYDARVELVSPAIPQSLSVPVGELKNRLDLARWLTSPKHPLTARVAVNRIWQMLFGQGLVRTPEDFGSQGALPTHPELLDWLAVDFIDHGWDQKRLIKQIVLSSTYRQSSDVSKEKLEIDPENRLLARASSYRMPAEMLRDNALAVSGLLVDKIGGAPVKPYEVEVSFKPSKRSQGEGLYRRSLYTYWKRTGPAPVMMTLDAAKRDVCRVKREQTSSPLQAFVMLNGPQFVEASRGVAQKILQEQKDNEPEQLEKLFRMLTSRLPTLAEAKILSDLYGAQQESFKANPDKAKQYLQVGDSIYDEKLNITKLAALTAVANALLNFDECVVKR